MTAPNDPSQDDSIAAALAGGIFSNRPAPQPIPAPRTEAPVSSEAPAQPYPPAPAPGLPESVAPVEHASETPPPIPGIAPHMPGPLPGEGASTYRDEKVRVSRSDEDTLPLAEALLGTMGAPSSREEEMAPSMEIPRDAARKPSVSGDPPGAALATPQLAAKPPWPMPAEVRGRAWLATMTALVIIGLYGYMLSFFYAGAHGGVDQAGYLMTARLLSGDMNIDDPATVAPPGTQPALASAPAAAAKTDTSIWQGNGVGYTEEHPAPAPIQTNPRWDWVRNRLSFVPESPFQFASRMCVMTEPFGPAIPDIPTTPTKAAVPAKPLEARIYAKYPFGYSLMAAMGRTIDAHFDKQTVLIMPERTTVHTTSAAPATGSSTIPAATSAAAEAAPAKPIRMEAVGKGFDGMYIVNPVCTVLACFFAYFMYRQAVSPFVALIGVIWLACNPLVLVYSNDANSHASTLFVVCMGFWGLISFMRTQQIWRAWVGGFSLGYACTIRYSEFLLVLPVLFAAIVHFRFTWRRAIGSLSLIAGWAMPIGVLAFVCWVAYGSPSKTGYTYCNEDTGFGWKYLSGDWGDRQLQGNWETLVTQVNRTGLFIMWPLALAGMFGLMGAAWRLGGVICLWIIPSVILYMSYYWAPGGDTTTGYLRFFTSIMPGLIFAGVWLLESALATVKGEKWAGLITGTLLGVFLLMVVAFYADGGPDTISGGVGKSIAGFASQTPKALWGLVKNSWLGFGCATTIFAAIAGMWILDRRIIASRLGVALGAGVITALGCAINLYTAIPMVETPFTRWTILRATVDNMREVLPRGSVVFCDDNLLNELDCMGGYKLYSVSTFSPSMYQQSKNRVEQSNSPDRIENPDPDPVQPARSRFYMELLSQPSSANGAISLGARSMANLKELQRAVIEKNIAEGHRITFLTLASGGDLSGGGGGAGGNVTVPSFDGYQIRALRKWTVSPPPSGPADSGAATAFAGVGGGGRGGRGGGGGRGGRGGGPGRQPFGIQPDPNANNAVPRQGPTYILYEVIKAPTQQKRAEASGPDASLAANSLGF